MRLTLSELRLRRLSLLGWAVSFVLLVLMIISVYPSVRDNPSMNAIYADLPPSMQGILGGADMVTPEGYLRTQAFAFFLPAVLLVFAIGRGAGTLAGEEQDRTLDLLLAQPLPRWSAYLQKSVALIAGMILLSAGVLAPLIIFDSSVKFDLAVVDLTAAVVQMLLFCLALALWAQAISSAVGRRGEGVAIVTGYAVVSYFVYGLSETVDFLKHLRPLTLWRWYLGNDPLGTGFGGRELAVLGATCAVALAAGIVAFTRRDLHI